MKRLLPVLALFAVLCGCCSCGRVIPTDGEVAVVPLPEHIVEGQGTFRLTSDAEVVLLFDDERLSGVTAALNKVLMPLFGRGPRVRHADKAADHAVNVTRDETMPAEAYRLFVTPCRIDIVAGGAQGAFYAVQTLRQLLPAAAYEADDVRAVELPVVTIEDKPCLGYRGMMLDVGRHFFTVDEVKEALDIMALHKLNVFHWHLTDDQGWRIEIRKYPKLTEIGSVRSRTLIGRDPGGTYDENCKFDETPYGGYYTQDEIRDVVNYAAERFITVIPEIEFPAHILSAVVAYPWLSCTGLQHEVPTQHFISRDLLCVGKESSLQFLRDVLDETVRLFPSSYINIGGDEAVYTRWEECPDCQKAMKREGLKKASELQGYLTNVVAEMMKEKNRTVVGWEEIFLRGDVKTPVVGLIWHNVRDTLLATQRGHKAILTPATHMYFDFPESRTPGEVKAATWMPPISLEKCYSMEINDYSPESTVLGVQGCFWSDQFIHGTALQEIDYLNENRSENYAEYFTFPRLLALSEVAWCRQSDRNYSDFRHRLSHHFNRLDFKNCHYRVPEPLIEQMNPTATGAIEFTLSPAVADADIRYTTDGSYPTVHSPLYTTPVTVDDKSDFRAITVVNPRHYSLPIYFAPDYSGYKQYGEYTAEWKPLNVQPYLTPWRFECTGKISGNGTYTVSFIYTKGETPFRLGALKLYKRDELLAEVPQSVLINADSPVATYRFTVDSFEAGTPFFIEVEACGEKGNDTSGLVFTNKVTQ